MKLQCIRFKVRIKHSIINENFQGELSTIIAHRLSTIKNADQVFILENGHIISQYLF